MFNVNTKHFELFFQSLQQKRADDLKRVQDAIASLNQRIEAAEKSVEEGNKLLKLCVLKLKSELASENNKKKELSTTK